MGKSGGETASSDAVSEPTASRPWQSYHTVYTNAKAGMEGIDKEKVQRIIYEMSKGSKYFENEEKKEAYMKQKIEKMRSQCAKLSDSQLSTCQMIADKRISELEATRDLSKVWIHVDMDAFYAAVETLCDPSLKGKPMAVGGLSMISTANYEARRFGVRAAMPGFIARRLCPELIFVPVDFKKYTYYSELTRKVFQKYDPNYTATSLDEAYLDITKVCLERGLSGASIAEELRTAVFEKTGLTCSAGVAPNRLLAKVCSDINKPNGQFVLPNDRRAVMTFISSLPIRKIGGIGKVTERILRDAIGISTCEEMIQRGGHICAFFSGSTAEFFLSIGLGLGRTDHPKIQLRKSISNERTFSATSDEDLLCQKLAELAELLSVDMQKEGLHGRTLTLKLKTASFEVRTRAVTLQKYICSRDEIYQHGTKLLKAELPNSLRLMGLRMSQFKEEMGGLSDPSQKTLKSFMREDASSKLLRDETCLGTDSSDRVLEDEISGVMTNENRVVVLSEPRDPSESPSISEQAISGGFIGVEETAGKVDILSNPSNETASRLKAPTVSATIRPCVASEICLMEEMDQSASESTSNQSEQILWIDNYKCRLCGVELPSCFVEERREHADFHLAEKLQKEETGCSSATVIPRQKILWSGALQTHNKSKKQKKSCDGVASSATGTVGRLGMFFETGIVFHLVATCLLCACSAERNSPLFFIFGDSLADVGNNNFIKTLAKGNVYPHGTDFGRPTGRFTNGQTAFDIIERELGSKEFTPPYLDPAMTTEAVIRRGTNYASSGSGFLNETGEIFGGRIGFHLQINYHTIARQAIMSTIGKVKAKKLLQRAVYVVAMGSNDLLYERATAKQRGLCSPDEFLGYLMSTIRTELTRLHGIDARKMVVTNAGPLGCIPFMRDVNSMLGNGCVGRMNARARLYNKRMKDLLVDLSKELEGSRILYADIYAVLDDLLKNYRSYGFENADSACCALGGVHGGLIPCGRKSRVCSDRSRYVFWDPFHLTESANRIAARKLLFGGPNFISPINISQLVKA